MSARVRIAGLILLTLLASGVRAEGLRYLSADAVNVVELLPAPAAIDSEEARAERDLMVALQQQRTEGQVARCRSEVKVTLAAFARVMGPWFTEENLPRLAQLLKHAEKDAGVFSGAAKNHFARKRPAAEDPRIKIAVENEDTPAYPSGHAMRGILFATILAQLAPQQQAPLLERGREIGWDRVIAGMHHPSDIVAGRVVGQAVARSLLASPRFQEELAAARAEFESVQKQKSRAEPAQVR
jgi:acid phosphatase (class A)